VKQFAILALFFFALTGCQNGHETFKTDSKSKFDLFGEENLAALTVVGPKGEPLAGAKVMIGDATSGRQFITTDADGKFQAPTDWKSPEVVSILANGYTRASYYSQTPNGQIFQLHLADKAATIEAKGVANGFDPYMVEKDGNVDIALVIPQLKREEIYFFNESVVLSSENDYIEVFGQKIPVPSNISIPKQKEKYGFVTFTVDKPIYRSRFSYPGDYQMMALRVRTTVGALKDRLPPMELLNQVLVNGGSERNVKVTDKGAMQDFAVGELQFNAKMSVTAPTDVPSGMIMLTMPLIRSGTTLYPSDVKTLKARESRQLSVPSTGANDLLNVITASDRTKNLAASANLLDLSNTSQTMQFLGILNKPSGDMTKVTIARPTLPTGVEPGGMYVTISTVATQKVDDVNVETTTRLWELYLQDWNEQIILPTLPSGMLEKAPNVVYRWEVSFMASDKTKTADQNSREVVSNLVKDISYVTRNSSDF
jgi:hypothetical protein